MRRTSLPWYNKSSAEESNRWEKDWTEFIKLNGFQLEGTPRGFVRSISIYDEPTITGLIKDSFQTFEGSQDFQNIQTKERTDMYSALQEVWQLKGVRNDLSITEALLIMLAVSKGYNVLNTKVDFLTKAAKGRLNQEALAKMINVNELKRKYKNTIINPPNFYVTVSTNGKIPTLIQNYAQYLTNAQQQRQNDKGYVVVRISDNNLDLLAYQADRAVFKHLYQQSVKRYNAIKWRGKNDAKAAFEAHLKDLQSYMKNPELAKGDKNFTTAKDWYLKSRELWNGVVDAYDLQITDRRNTIFGAVVNILQGWFQTYQLGNFLSNGRILERPDSNYKLRMTHWVAENVFAGSIAYNEEYSKQQHEIYLGHAPKEDDRSIALGGRHTWSGKTFYFATLPKTGKDYTQQLKEASYSNLVTKLGANSYLAQNWHHARSAYNEQVTYWLDVVCGDPFYTKNYIAQFHKAWAPQDLTENNVNSIKFY